MQFEQLGLMAELVHTVASQGYARPTPIQTQAIPVVLDGRDILAGAQTGTGKTAAFALPILQLLNESERRYPDKRKAPRALVLTPTRELAAQVAESVKTYGGSLSMRSTVVFGGVGFNPQKDKLSRGVDILVATPGRLLDHASQRTVDLSAVEILVLDEADRMLDMGFIHDIRKILALLPQRRQNLLFSATYSAEIKRLADNLLHQPELIEVARRSLAADTVTQHLYRVEKSAKRDLLIHLIEDGQWYQVLVFTRTKHGANRLAEQLCRAGIEAAAIHGNKSQNARTQALARFKDGTVHVLVATDIAARGLDIDNLSHVVNYELPNEPDSYVHRIGRTGRAGESGASVSLVDNDELKLLKDIQRLLNKEIEVLPLPAFESQRPAAPGQPAHKPGSHSQPHHANGRHRGAPKGRSAHTGAGSGPPRPGRRKRRAGNANRTSHNAGAAR